jgi:hypothetical protein
MPGLSALATRPSRLGTSHSCEEHQPAQGRFCTWHRKFTNNGCHPRSRGVRCFVLNGGNWRGRRDLVPRAQPWQGYDTGPPDFAQLREISTKLRNFNMIVWSITPRSGASGITFGIPSGPGSACGKRATRRPSRTVETSHWRCISGIEWHRHQEPRRLRR